jgi:mxaK protein
MSRAGRRLRLGLGGAALLAGMFSAGAGGFALWRAQAENAQISALAAGRDLAVASDASDRVALARGLRLIALGNLDGAQAVADRMAAGGGGSARAELLYALGNAQLRRGLVLIRTVPYRQAVPVLSLARAAYREALRLDPGDWDARYNYALVAPLLRDAEAAQPSFGDQMAHGRAAWPDIPGAPNGMP